MAMTYDIGIADSGFIRHMISRLSVSDRGESYRIGIENVSSFDSFNAPHFSMVPDPAQIVDFNEVLDAILAMKAQDQDTAQDQEDAPDSGTEEEPAQSGESM